MPTKLRKARNAWGEQTEREVLIEELGKMKPRTLSGRRLGKPRLKAGPCGW
jgi:hypothetical protein